MRVHKRAEKPILRLLDAIELCRIDMLNDHSGEELEDLFSDEQFTGAKVSLPIHKGANLKMKAGQIEATLNKLCEAEDLPPIEVKFNTDRPYRATEITLTMKGDIPEILEKLRKAVPNVSFSHTFDSSLLDWSRINNNPTFMLHSILEDAKNAAGPDNSHSIQLLNNTHSSALAESLKIVQKQLECSAEYKISIKATGQFVIFEGPKLHEALESILAKLRDPEMTEVINDQIPEEYGVSIRAAFIEEHAFHAK